MKILGYNQLPSSKNIPLQTIQTRLPTLKQQVQGENGLFQQLLQVEQTLVGKTETKETLRPASEVFISSAGGADHDDISITEEMGALFPLLPTNIQQMFQEQGEMDLISFQSPIDQQQDSTMKKLIVKLATIVQRNGAQKLESAQQFELPVTWNQNMDDGSSDVREISATLKKQKTEQTKIDFFKWMEQNQFTSFSNFSQVRNSLNLLTLVQSAPFQPYGLSANMKNASLIKTEETTNQKHSYAEVMNKLLLSAHDLPAASQQQAPMISLEETGTTKSINEQFIYQFTNVVKLSKFTKLGNGQLQLVIRLHPEHLGTLTVKLTQENGEMTAKIIASSASAKELVEANIRQISHVIPTQHITIEQFDVRNYDGMSPYQQSDQQRDRRGQQHQEQRQQFNKEEKLHFQDSLMNEILNIEV